MLSGERAGAPGRGEGPGGGPVVGWWGPRTQGQTDTRLG